MTQAQGILQGVAAGLNVLLNSINAELEQGQAALQECGRLKTENETLTVELATLVAEKEALMKELAAVPLLSSKEGEAAP